MIIIIMRHFKWC